MTANSLSCEMHLTYETQTYPIFINRRNMSGLILLVISCALSKDIKTSQHPPNCFELKHIRTKTKYQVWELMK